MLTHVWRALPDRKLRLFACACCRRVWKLLVDERSRKAVEVGEAFANEAVEERELEAAGKAAHVAAAELSHVSYDEAAFAASFCATVKTSLLPAASRRVLAAVEQKDQERAVQATILRDIVGNPFHPTRINPDWLVFNGCTIAEIALAIYENQSYERLPILADALEDAGCSDSVILLHCRNDEHHWRGCWVVDLLLDRDSRDS
jgi:hypothetical protein